MEDLIATAPQPPVWWFRYVDDTLCKLKNCYSQEFTDHLNSLDPDIKFTAEGEGNKTLAFMDTLTLSVIQSDGSRIYHKSTHTDQFLNFNSNQPVDHNLGVIRTLYHRADTVITDDLDNQAEKSHVNSVHAKCRYPKWALDRALKQMQKKAPPALRTPSQLAKAR